MNAFIEKIKVRRHRRHDSSASHSSASASVGAVEECSHGLDYSELASPDGWSFRTAPLVLCNDSSPARAVPPSDMHCDLSEPRLQPGAALRPLSHRRSRFSRNLMQVLNDPCELGYFITFMESQGFKQLVKFWLETETFRVTASRLAASVGETRGEKCGDPDGDEGIRGVPATCTPLQQVTEQDAVAIFAKYISKEAGQSQSIGATDELRDNVINRICCVDGRLDPDCFSSAQRFVLDIIEKRFFGAYLDSVVHCKYVLELLSSGHVFITDILYNDVALFHFAEFMEQEGQRTLIEFWLSVDSFQQQLGSNGKTLRGDQAQKDAMVLYDRYFSMQATSPVGFDDELRMEIENNICREDNLGPSADCFDKPFRYVMKLMEQKWLPRFVRSVWYERYLSELISAARYYDLDLPNPTGRRSKTSATASTVSSGGCSADGECPRALVARAKQAEAVAGSSCNDMAIETTQYDPNTLWKRDKARHGFGYVDHVGRYVREYRLASHHRRTKSGGEKISEAVRKFVHRDTKEQEALAEEVAALIVQDVTSMAHCAGDSSTGASDGLS